MPNQPHPDKRQVHFYLHKTLLEKLDRIATASGLSRTQVLTKLIRMTPEKLWETKGN